MKHLSRSTLAVHDLQMPVDGAAIGEIVVSQQIEAVLQDFLRLPQDSLHLVRESLLQQLQYGIDPVASEEKIPSSDRAGCPHIPCKVEPYACQQPVLALGQLLPHAVATFIPVHTAQAVRNLPPFRQIHRL